MGRSKAVQALAQQPRAARLAWDKLDILLAVLLYPLPVVMWLWPYAIADLADTVIGPTWLAPALAVVLRLGVIVFGIYTVVSRRTASWWLRLPIAALAIGTVGNWSRDRLYGTPLTLSVLILLGGVAVLIWRLGAVDGDTTRRKVAEREVARLRIENDNLKAERK